MTLDLNLCASCQHEKHIGRNCNAELVGKDDMGRTHIDQCKCSDAQARKATSGKPGGFYLIPFMSILELAGIYEYGSKKYAANSWREVPKDPETGASPEERYFDAMVRHLIAYRHGEAYDPESGKRHLAHAMWGVVALMEFSRERDERAKDEGVEANKSKP